MKKVLICFILTLAIIPLAYSAQGFPKHPNVVDVTLSSASNEYSTTFPEGTGDITMQSRGGNDFYVSNTPNSTWTKYYTVKSGAVYKAGPLSVTSPEITRDTTIYLRGSTGSQVVEILYWQ